MSLTKHHDEIAPGKFKRNTLTVPLEWAVKFCGLKKLEIELRVTRETLKRNKQP